jgi:multiple sugar transport system permease protein
MPILPAIGRKTPKVRLVIAAIYALLVLGGITMVYPLLVMLSGSVKGQADTEQMDALPEFLLSPRLRFARFMEDRYGTLTNLSSAYGREVMRFRDLPEAPGGEQVALLRGFLRSQTAAPDHFYWVADAGNIQSMQLRNFRALREALRSECGSVREFTRRYGLPITTWNDFPGVLDNPATKEFNYERTALYDRYLRFKRALPAADRAWVNVDGLYVLAQSKMAGTKSGAWPRQSLLAERMPPGAAAKPWAEFVKHGLNCLFVRLDDDGLAGFRADLWRRFGGDVGKMNALLETSYSSFADIRCTLEELRDSALFTAYTQFITDRCPPERLLVDAMNTRYRAYAAAHQPDAARTAPPIAAYDHAVFEATHGAWLTETLTRNYRIVVGYVTVYGRAVLNTVALIGLSVLAALLVNPAAAYALSRFRLKNTYGILMFFLATMAFPGAVTMIPNFLLLKELHLLNSYWALVLPGLANGFNIFILKGFFDSIPQEMYESAMLDGAGEWVMFWRFTMALSTPVLALTALGAFTSAYSAFMFALIICPDERMWTIMVWLYQLQQTAHQSVVFAALVLAALPTLLVFVLAQRVIMQGIVVPIEK